MRENAVEDVMPVLAPQNKFGWAFHERQNCGIDILIHENRYQVDQKEKKCKII